jgi:glutamine amidotransferase-like uncharacterized protein
MKPTIALFIADPKCSVQCINGMMASLGSNYNFKIFSKNALENNFFENVDMIAVPGGIGDAESFHHLFKHNKERVLEFVLKGGKYLGICMGAYWAGSNYFDMLDDVDAVQYITRPNSETRRPHAKAIEIKWNGHPDRMFFYDGCALVGDNNKFKTVASYANCDAMAIIQNNIGLIGCHPESEKFWYDSYSWMGKHWHNNAHHKLLLEFVNEMFT